MKLVTHPTSNRLNPILIKINTVRLTGVHFAAESYPEVSQKAQNCGVILIFGLWYTFL